MSALKQFVVGIWKENPVTVLMLGLCPALAVTTSAVNGLGMGVVTLAVLVVSNLLFSLLRKVIPTAAVLPLRVVVTVFLAAVAEILMKCTFYALAVSLGVYLPLVAVSTLVLGRGETFAAKNPPLPAVMDGLGMGLGFTLVLTVVGLLREILGAGTAFGFDVTLGFYQPMDFFMKAPGAFLMVALAAAVGALCRGKGKSETHEEEGEEK